MKGEIHKVVKIRENSDGWNYYYYDDNDGDVEIEIVKNSENLIDLIEEKDILVLNEDNGFCKYEYLFQLHKGEAFEEIKKRIKKGKCKVKSILTHEQYERNCFKVGVKE